MVTKIFYLEHEIDFTSSSPNKTIKIIIIIICITYILFAILGINCYYSLLTLSAVEIALAMRD